MRKSIVLAHGVLGFGEPALPFFPNYFNGVAAHLRGNGHFVVAPQVNPAGSVKTRGDKLASEILSLPASRDPIHIIAHSMGGLDARHAITNVAGVAQRVATLVTIGTPHRGSPVGDAIVNHTDPLRAHIPEFLVTQLELNGAALRDLTTAVAEQFDRDTDDVPGIEYIEVAGDASQGGDELFLFKLAAAIGRIKGETNDGVVTKKSALCERPRHRHLKDWPVDHAGEVGWSKATPLPIVDLPLLKKIFQLVSGARINKTKPPHFDRYDAIVEML